MKKCDSAMMAPTVKLPPNSREGGRASPRAFRAPASRVCRGSIVAGSRALLVWSGINNRLRVFVHNSAFRVLERAWNRMLFFVVSSSQSLHKYNDSSKQEGCRRLLAAPINHVFFLWRRAACSPTRRREHAVTLHATCVMAATQGDTRQRWRYRRLGGGEAKAAVERRRGGVVVAAVGASAKPPTQLPAASTRE
jgi:hypothetical protein